MSAAPSIKFEDASENQACRPSCSTLVPSRSRQISAVGVFVGVVRIDAPVEVYRLGVELPLIHKTRGRTYFAALGATSPGLARLQMASNPPAPLEIGPTAGMPE